jgi:hypothetical protein
MLSPATRQRVTRLSVVLCLNCMSAIAATSHGPFIDAGYSEAQLQEMRDRNKEGD